MVNFFLAKFNLNATFSVQVFIITRQFLCRLYTVVDLLCKLLYELSELLYNASM